MVELALIANLSDSPILCQRIPASGDHSTIRLETLTSPESKLKSRLLSNYCCAVREKPTKNTLWSPLTLNFKWVQFMALNVQLAAWGEQFYSNLTWMVGKKVLTQLCQWGFQVDLSGEVSSTAPPNGPARLVHWQIMALWSISWIWRGKFANFMSLSLNRYRKKLTYQDEYYYIKCNIKCILSLPLGNLQWNQFQTRYTETILIAQSICNWTICTKKPYTDHECAFLQLVSSQAPPSGLRPVSSITSTLYCFQLERDWTAHDWITSFPITMSQWWHVSCFIVIVAIVCKTQFLERLRTKRGINRGI